MASVNNASSVMDIEYDDMAALMSSAGIFSFCVYTYPGAFNANINSTYKLSVSGGKYPHVYFVGILSYIEMINRHPEQWTNWRVVVHTDKETIETNPKAFDILKRKGAIFGITTLKGRYSDIKLFRGIFRNNRYFPLFIEGLNVPVLIRDADTIYESELVKEIQERLLTKQKNNTKAVINIGSEEIIPTEFIEKLNKWEHLFVERISTFKDKVIFTYDDSYSLPLKNENNIGKMVWTGRPENRPKHKPEPGKFRRSNYMAVKVRFLAGNLSKVGAALPSELWTRALPDFLSKYITNANIKSDALLKKTTISDEVYLTEVIYPWCKEHNRAEFYKMNYVSAHRLHGLFDRYISKKYPINSHPNVYSITEEEIPNYSSVSRNNNNNVTAGTPPPGPALGFGAWPPAPLKTIKVTRKTIKKNKLNKNNQKLYNISNPSGLRDMTYIQRPVANRLSLNNPEIMMNANFFFNPLTNDLSKRPNSLPEYFFGGTKRRRFHKRKTYKNRK